MISGNHLYLTCIWAMSNGLYHEFIRCLNLKFILWLVGILVVCLYVVASMLSSTRTYLYVCMYVCMYVFGF